MWKSKVKDCPVLFLIANSISWFSLTMLIIGDFAGSFSTNDTLTIAAGYFGGLIVSATIGATILQNKLKNKGILLSWILFGAATCALFSQVPLTEVLNMTLASLILGVSVGLGIPTCFAFFANQTKIENRGRNGAVLFFLIQLFSALVILSQSDMGVGNQFLILAVWRLIGVVGIIGYNSQMVQDKEQTTSIKSVIREKSFILFFLPWFLFTLVNFIEAPVIETYFGPELFNTSVLATTFISSISAFLAGTLCDYKGRKITGIIGFVLLGLGYAFLSFLIGPEKLIAQYLYILCDGLAWGILFVTFIFVVWGDLSENKTREKYYLVGSMPFLFSGVIEMLIQPIAKDIAISTAFSLASFFLFIAIVPLLYSTETLPEKAMKDRDLKSYLDKAQKIAEKKANTSQHKEKTKTEKKEEPEAEEGKSKVYEEAQKLAEKYY
ncbi:MAG: MFS transporter [Candidatus Bathyarchaeia archaeon]|jgi:MFS family permease